MAFVHNQKTLELGMRMAETLRDSVRAMADSQADWIKSMASARGFLRNAPPPQLPPPPTEEKPDDDDDDEIDELPPPAPSWVEAVTPTVTVVTQQIIQAVMGFTQKPKNDETDAIRARGREPYVGRGHARALRAAWNAEADVHASRGAEARRSESCA